MQQAETTPTTLKKQSRGTKFVKDLGIYAIGNIGAKAITFFMVPLYTYFVDAPNDYGYYDLSLTIIFLVMPFVTLQLRDGAFRFLIGSGSDEERRQLVSIIYRVLGTMFLISALITLLVALIHPVGYLWQIFALLIAMCLQEVVSQVFRGLGHTKAFVTVGILSALGTAIFSIIFLVPMHMGIEGIYLANILSRLLAIGLVELRVQTLRRFFSIKVTGKAIARELLRYTLPLLPGSLCWWLLGSSDRWFVTHFLGLEATGIYAVAIRLTSIVQILTTIFYQAWQETALRQYNSPDRNRFFSEMLNSYIFLLSVLVIGFCFVVKMNYGWLVDDNYAASVRYLMPGAVSSGVFAVSAFFDLGYQCAKDTKRTLPGVIGCAVLSIVLNFTTVPVLGVWGVLLNSIVCWLVLCLWRWHDMKRYMTLRIDKRSALPVVLLLVTAVPYYLDTAWWQDLLVLVVALVVLWRLCPPMVRQWASDAMSQTKAKLK